MLDSLGETVALKFAHNIQRLPPLPPSSVQELYSTTVHHASKGNETCKANQRAISFQLRHAM